MEKSQLGKSLTPAQNLVAEIEADYKYRSGWIDEAKWRLTMAGLVGGAAIWTVESKSGALIAGIQAGYAFFEAGKGAIALGNARDLAHEAVALRSTLAEHELATGEVYYPADALRQKATEDPQSSEA